MTIKDLLDNHYNQDKWFKIFKEKFPQMYNFSSEVEIIPWKDEYAIVDKNPEVIDEIEFWEYLYKNALITEKEYQKKLQELTRPASKTIGIAFIKTKQVSFRTEFPPLLVILHELGHCYYEEEDPIWSSVYGGGEFLMNLILMGKFEGNEETIKYYHSLLHIGYTCPSVLEAKLNEVAEELLEEILVAKDIIEILPGVPKTPINIYASCSGWLRRPDDPPTMVLVEALEGVRWNDSWWVRFVKKLFQNQGGPNDKDV